MAKTHNKGEVYNSKKRVKNLAQNTRQEKQKETQKSITIPPIRKPRTATGKSAKDSPLFEPSKIKRDNSDKKQATTREIPKRVHRTKANKKQYNRVTNFIRRAEKRGYKFDYVLKAELKTLSTSKLKALTPAKLYERSVNIKYGKEISGTQARQIERSLAGKKAYKTRKEREKERERENEDYLPSYSTLVLEEIKSLIRQYATSKSEVRSTIGDYLLELLETQIRNYGEEAVAKACEQAPDQIKATIESIIFESKDDRRRDKIAEFVQLITGVIPTIDESKEFTELAEEFEVYNNI